jgi:uncharacterized damage-inducible protein DinB
MDSKDVLIELFGRISGHVHGVVDGLTPDQLLEVIEPDTNPIGWLLWHLARVQDHHVAEILDEQQVWITGDWAGRFSLEPDPHNLGYGHTPEQVRAVRPEGPEVLVEYYEAVWSRTEELLERTQAEDLDRIVDRRWDPPVTLGVRLVSIADDDIQHAGQAAYLRGLLDRRPASAERSAAGGPPPAP